ncbi:MAG TPA: hypothetical protein VMU30_03835, partial [Bacteroidota bacterium]|nr:hypothetical protein [Bacteroidota bacterium]
MKSKSIYWLIIIACLSLSCTDDMVFNNPFDSEISLTAPSNLQIVYLQEFSVKLKWQQSANITSSTVDNAVQTIIEQSINAGPYIVIDTVYGYTEAIINETVTPNNSYSFRIHIAAGTKISNSSNVVSASLAPYAPTNLQSTIVDETHCRLTWKDNSLSEIGFRVQRKIGPTGTFTTIGQAPTDTTTFMDSTVTFTDSVYYRICAVYDSGKTSNYCLTTIFASFVPSNLSTTVNNEFVRSLSWQDHSITEIGFRIERAIGATGTFTVIGQVPANTVCYNDSTLILNDSVLYRVCAVYKNQLGGYDSLSIINSYTPYNFIVSNLSEATRTLSWQTHSICQSSFHIERRMIPNGTFAPFALLAANSTSYNDTSIIQTDTLYEYRVYADYGNGNYSKSCSLDVELPFPAPNNLQVTNLSPTSLKLIWNDNSSFENGFLIERSEQNGAYNILTTTGPNATSFSDTHVDSTKEYQYRISAVTAHNQSKYCTTPLLQYFIPPIQIATSLPTYDDGGGGTCNDFAGSYSIIQPNPDGSSLLVCGTVHNACTGNFEYKAWNDVELYVGNHGINISCAAIGPKTYSENNFHPVPCIATAADDTSLVFQGTSTLWGDVRFSIPLTHHILKLVFSIDGTKIFGACDDNTIRCWNIAQKNLLFTTSVLSDKISALDVTTDGKYVVSASGSTITLWN